MITELKETTERARFFQNVHAWPLSNDLNYEGCLNNFKTDEDKRIACLILDFFTYYPENMVEQMLKTSVGQAGHTLSKEFSDWKHTDFNTRCLYSAIPGERPNPADSGNFFARILRNLGVPEDNIIDYKVLPDRLAILNKPTPVIFVDDFVGSGVQVDTAWNITLCNNGKTLSEIATNGSHVFLYTPLIMNSSGYYHIKNNCKGLHLSAPHILGGEYNLFNSNCICWKNDDSLYKAGEELILRKGRELGIPSTDGAATTDIKGYGKQGLAIKFAHGAPDAVLPFFYWCHDNWVPLFNKPYER